MKAQVVLFVMMAVLTVGGVAQADTITATFSGTALDGSDYANLFGGGNLTGKSITLSFTYNVTALNTAATLGTDGSNYAANSQVQGWNDYSGDATGVDSITINGDTLTETNNIPGSTYDQVWNCLSTYCGGSIPSTFKSDIENGAGQVLGFYFYSTDDTIGVNTASGLDAILTSPYFEYGSDGMIALDAQDYIDVDLSLVSLTDTPDPTVPEPGTVTLTMLGLSYLGARFRRRFQAAK